MTKMPPESIVNGATSCTKQPLLRQQQKTMAVMFKSNGGSSKKQKTASSKKRCPPSIKCVLVGDGAVGKTSLAVSYSNDTFPSEYVPTAFDNYNVVVQVDGEPVRIELCDTAGQDELDPLRSLCYPDTDVFMLCFSVVQPSSFRSACTRWADELGARGGAVVLVGTQADLRQHPGTLQVLRRRAQVPVSQEEAQKLAERLGAPYIETSALTCTHLKEAFDEAIVAALRRRDRWKSKRPLWKRLCCVN